VYCDNNPLIYVDVSGKGLGGAPANEDKTGGIGGGAPPGASAGAGAGVATAVGQAVKGFWDWSKDKAGALWQWTKGNAKSLWDGAKEGVKKLIGKVETGVTQEKPIFNFTKTAANHMDEAGRTIPVQTLDNVIKTPMAVVKDPKGATDAMMYYSRMWKNGKLYNVEVLYDKATNTIMHFQYGRNAMGPLKAIPKPNPN